MSLRKQGKEVKMTNMSIQQKLRLRYCYVLPSFNGIAVAHTESGRYCHIREADGEALYFQRFDDVGIFDENGLAPARKDNKCFHIHLDGKRAYSWAFDFAGAFFNNRAVVIQYGQWFHINTSGLPIYDERYDQVTHFKNGHAWVKKNNFWFKINHEGVIISEPQPSPLN